MPGLSEIISARSQQGFRMGCTGIARELDILPTEWTKLRLGFLISRTVQAESGLLQDIKGTPSLLFGFSSSRDYMTPRDNALINNAIVGGFDNDATMVDDVNAMKSNFYTGNSTNQHFVLQAGVRTYFTTTNLTEDYHLPLNDVAATDWFYPILMEIEKLTVDGNNLCTEFKFNQLCATGSSTRTDASAAMMDLAMARDPWDASAAGFDTDLSGAYSESTEASIIFNEPVNGALNTVFFRWSKNALPLDIHYISVQPY